MVTIIQQPCNTLDLTFLKMRKEVESFCCIRHGVKALKNKTSLEQQSASSGVVVLLDPNAAEIGLALREMPG